MPRDGDPKSARARLGVTALIGVSAHNLDEAKRAEKAGADYVTLSPVFASDSKPGYGPALGLDGLTAVVHAVALPVLALGGVTAARVPACVKAGATGVAVMGEVMRGEDPETCMAGIDSAFRNMPDMPREVRAPQ